MWIEYNLTNDESIESVSSKVDDLVSEDIEKAWQLILVILKKDNSEAVIANLSAGPLEDLLVQHGEDIIDRVEAKAKQDADFRKVLMGVWQNAMSENVWSRVEALQLEYG